VRAVHGGQLRHQDGQQVPQEFDLQL
jgi:hypothetical protein